MLEHPSQTSNEEPMVTLEFVPMEEEEGDFDTLINIEQVYAEVQRELMQREDIAIKFSSTDERGIDILILISLIGTTIVASKDLLTSFFNVITAAIELLTKKEHIQEIEIIAGGKTIILRNLNRKTAKEIIEAFAAQYPEASMTSIPGNVIKVKAKVSKKSRARN